MAPSGQLTGWIRGAGHPLFPPKDAPLQPPWSLADHSASMGPEAPLGLTGEGQTPSRGPLKMGETWTGEHSACRGSRRTSSSPTPLAQGASHLDPARPVPGHRGGARDPGARPWTHRSQRGDPRLQGHMGTCCGDTGRGSAASLLASPHPSEMCWVGDAARAGPSLRVSFAHCPLGKSQGAKETSTGKLQSCGYHQDAGALTPDSRRV